MKRHLDSDQLAWVIFILVLLVCCGGVLTAWSTNFWPMFDALLDSVFADGMAAGAQLCPGGPR